MQTPHILIVEDELVTRNTLKSIFEAEGYDVFEATDGAEMHQILSENDINLVIMDINLPGKNGLLLARELREQQVEARRLLESIHGALKADGDLLSTEERAHIDGLVETLSGLVTSDDADAIRNAIETLSKETESFAARRMNRSILAALAGHSVDDFASEGKE